MSPWTRGWCAGNVRTPLSSRPGARAVRPMWAGDLGRVVDVRDVLAGSVHPSGEVLVVDEIGFHHATSVAELLARRGAAVEIETPAMVVGQDLATTLDLPEFTCRAPRWP
jgi:hypothetical protein